MTGKKRKSLAGRLLCLTLALCLGFSSCTALAASKDTQDKIDKVKQEKNEAEEEKKKTEQEQNKLNNACATSGKSPSSAPKTCPSPTTCTSWRRS